MSVADFFDMVRAKLKIEEEEFDMKMQMLSWQTAILINAMGKSKKRYKPKDLYKPISSDDDVLEVKGSYKVVGDEKQEQLRKELLETFGHSIDSV